MITFLPNAAFLSEVSRAVGIAKALCERGEEVAFATRGGPYVDVLSDEGFVPTRLDPPLDTVGARAFLDALLDMGKGDRPFFTDDELRAAVASEVAFLRATGAELAVTGFTLSAYLSTRMVGVPLATDHGGVFVPPMLAHDLCPAPVNPPRPEMQRLPAFLQRVLANRLPALLRAPTAQLNAHARALGVEEVPGLLGLMCGDLTLVTELPDVLGIPASVLEEWRPRWPFRVRKGTTFRYSGPLYATLDRPIPPRVEAFLAADGPVVLVAPTSVDEALLRGIVGAARGAGVRMLVAATVHPVADLEDDRTLVAGLLPNHRVFPRVAAAVIMGGQGSVQTALAAGVPFVGIPYHGEQELNVAVAERLGAAIRLGPTSAAGPALTTSLRRLIEEPSFAVAARAASGRYAGVDGAARAADVILAWLAERGRRSALM